MAADDSREPREGPAKVALALGAGFAIVIPSMAPFGRRVQAGLLTAVDAVGPFFVSITAGIVGSVVLFVYVSAATRRTSPGNLLGTLVLAATLCIAGFLMTIDPIERIHVAEYGAMAFALLFGLRRRAFALFLLSNAVSLVDEAVQAFTPDRVADVRDLTLNCLGTCIGWVLARPWLRQLVR